MILALRALGVGDLVTAVPALRGLQAAHPGETLALAAPAWLTPLIDLIGGIGRVVPIDGLGAHPLPRASLAVNLHGSGPESHRMLLASGPAKLWAYACPSFSDGPEWSDDEHEVHRWCHLLGFYGVVCDEADISLRSPDLSVPQGVVIVHPGAKSPSRRWPPSRYANVARALRLAGHRVLITCSPAERELALGVAVAAGLNEDAVPVTGLGELAALVASAALVISGDTGIAHLATAYRTPSVVLFGPMSPARWGPPPRPYHRAIWHGTRSERGDSTAPGVHPALLAIKEDEVLEAAGYAAGQWSGSST